VPVWYVAPLEMKEGTHWDQGYNRSVRLQCRRRPNKAIFNLLKVCDIFRVLAGNGGVIASVCVCVCFQSFQLWSSSYGTIK
jgi:hypothetical protein